MTEQEAIYGSKPSPSKSGTKNYRPSIGGAAASKRFSLGGAALQNTLADKASLSSRSHLKSNNPVKRLTSNSHHHSGSLAHSSGNRCSATFEFNFREPVMINYHASLCNGKILKQQYYNNVND